MFAEMHVAQSHPNRFKSIAKPMTKVLDNEILDV